MMSAETIRDFQREAAERASADDLKPFIVWQEDLDQWHAEAKEGYAPNFPFPSIGDYVPKGWTLVDRHFVDNSGFGAPDEPALTWQQFLGELQVNFGYAIIEEGQFQVYIGKFTSPYFQAVVTP